MRLEIIDLKNYINNFADFTDVQCDSFIKRILGSKGILIGGYLENIPVGVAVIGLSSITKEACVYYIFIRKEYRGRGIGETMLLKSMKFLESSGVLKIAIDVILENAYGNVMNHIMVKNNIPVEKKFTSYKCFTDDNSNKKWTSFFNKKGIRLLSYATKHGLFCESFKNVDNCIIEDVKFNAEKFSFGINLLSIYNQIDKDLSFLVYDEKNKAVAFAVSRIINYNPTVIEIPYFSVLESYRRSSVFALLLIKLISKCFESNDRVIVFCVDNTNEQMNRPIKKILDGIIRTEKSQLVYVKEKSN